MQTSGLGSVNRSSDAEWTIAERAMGGVADVRWILSEEVSAYEMQPEVGRLGAPSRRAAGGTDPAV